MLTFVYSPAYDCDIGEHVFPVVKYRILHDLLQKDPQFSGIEFLEPTAVSKTALAFVHTPQYIDDILSQLGNLRLTIHGLKSRDRFILQQCAGRGIPVAVLAAGGGRRKHRRHHSNPLQHLPNTPR